MAYLIEAQRRNRETGKMEGYFRIGEKVQGHQVTHTLGFVPRREAERLLRIYEGRRAAGESADLLPRLEPGSSVRPLAAWIEERLGPFLDGKGASAKTRESHMNSARHLTRLLGAVSLDALTPHRLDGYVSSRKAEGVRTRTIQIELACLRHLLGLAVEERLLPALPRIPRPSVTDARPHVFLTPAQATRLLEALPWGQEPASCLAIYCGLDLGLRRGEILSRRWENVRWGQTSNGALYVGNQVVGQDFRFRTKSGKGRTVPLTEGVSAVLTSWWTLQGQPETGWIFPSPVNPARPMGNFKRTLATACRVAGVPVLHVHAMRHTWATGLAVAGVPRALAQKLGGWSSPEMLDQVYEHALTDMEAEAMQAAAVRPTEGRVIRLHSAATQR